MTNYPEIHSRWYRVSVKWIIRNEEGNVLVCKEEDWRWDIPWWGLDRWEDPIECLKREINEEMWLKVTSCMKNPSAFIVAERVSSDTRPWIANVCYEIKVEHLNFTPSDECVEIWFFNLEDLESINSFENVVPVFKQLFS